VRNIKAIAMLVLAVLIGLGAAFYAARWVAQRGTLAASEVVVAAVDIELGSKINPQMLTTVKWPSDSVPQGAFTSVAALQDRVVKVGVQRGDAIVERKLSAVGTKGGLSAVISEGKRAMTVRVNDVVGVAGFALPGNYVDVMVNTQQGERAGGDGQNTISMTVLEQVLVLAVAQEASRDDMKPKVVSAVTLELSPLDAEKLDLARSVGTLSLVLRNQLDKQVVATRGVTRAQLLGMQPVVQKAVAAPSPAVVRPQPVRVAQPAPTDCVEVIRNGARAVSCF
jgi:pilus assembly protein CpaB